MVLDCRSLRIIWNWADLSLAWALFLHEKWVLKIFKIWLLTRWSQKPMILYELFLRLQDIVLLVQHFLNLVVFLNSRLKRLNLIVWGSPWLNLNLLLPSSLLLFKMVIFSLTWWSVTRQFLNLVKNAPWPLIYTRLKWIELLLRMMAARVLSTRKRISRCENRLSTVLIVFHIIVLIWLILIRLMQRQTFGILLLDLFKESMVQLLVSWLNHVIL